MAIIQSHPRIEEGVTNKAFDAEEGESRTRDSVVSCIVYIQHSIQKSILKVSNVYKRFGSDHTVFALLYSKFYKV